ncbi:angiopoietin-related protein 1-like [Anopheles albimanus]|uniref:angiopoietin-related protein 1-like n=1 Tax=Anopheles albimanus TaxID=7167 RepID=UPI00163E8017|nr:angiopoietin-related protein 1-like [Anopheles albimanus]
MKRIIALIVLCAALYIAADDPGKDNSNGTVLDTQHDDIPSSCKAALATSTASGTYQIRVKSDLEPFSVYCEQQDFGGGWIVIQHRYNGSLDFYRDWDEFRDGFGDLEQEFWLGLEKMHQITTGRKHELIVELRKFGGNYTYARYDAFEIGSESEDYVLKAVGKYKGTAGNALWYNKGMKFTTKDRDNDDYDATQCAHSHEGAWWHRACSLTSLNGRYMDDNHRYSIFWHTVRHGFFGLGYTRMMIRELE